MTSPIESRAVCWAFTLICACVPSYGQTGGGPASAAPATAFQTTLNALASGNYPPQHSLLIYQHGELLLERYWAGDDLVYGKKHNRDFGPNDLHGTRSCTKSVVGLLIGIAIHEKLLPSLDTAAFQLFPDLDLESQPSFTESHRKITLAHLLTMTDGLDWQQYETTDHVNNESELEGSANAAAYVWSQPMKRVPGETFNYNSGSTALLARAVRRAAGKNIEQYAAESLFRPLQIERWEWLKDSDGEPAAHFGLRLTPRSMAKIGQLVLQKGKWKGKQVVPESWINSMSDHHNRTRRYGYQWWLEEFPVGTRIAEGVVAYGRGGQTIFVLPQQRAVVVLTAGHYDDNKAAGARNALLKDQILPELMVRQR